MNCPLSWLYIGLYAAYLVGMLYTSNLENGWEILSRKFSILIFPIVIVTSGSLGPARLRLIAVSFVISCLSISIACIGYQGYKAINMEHFPSQNWDLINGPVYFEQHPGITSMILDYFSYINLGSLIQMQPTYFGLYLGFCVLLICNYYLPRLEIISPLESFFFMVAVCYCSIFTIFLSSRIAILGYLIGVVGFVFYWYKEQKMMRNGLAIISIYLIIFFGVMYLSPVTYHRFFWEPSKTKMEIAKDSGSWNSTNLRFYHWYASWLQFKNNWLWGVGTGDVSEAIGGSYSQMNMSPAPINDSHNQYLEVAVALGLFGLTLLVLGLIIPAILALEKGAILYLSFLALFAIVCGTESLMERHKGVMFYTVFNSLMAFGYLGHEVSRRHSRIGRFFSPSTEPL